MTTYNVSSASNAAARYVPDSIARESNKQLVVDAVYLVIRVLRNHVRGYRELNVSSELGSEVKSLARQAISEIEKAAGRSVTEFSEEKTSEYINSLSDFQSESVLNGPIQSDGSEVQVLNNMRNQNI